MRTVHKKTLDLTAGTQRVQLPVDAEIVRVHAQHDLPTIWYETDTDTTHVMLHSIKVIGTGSEVPADWIYLGTADIGDFVFHLYAARVPGRHYTEGVPR